MRKFLIFIILAPVAGISTLRAEIIEYKCGKVTPGKCYAIKSEDMCYPAIKITRDKRETFNRIPGTGFICPKSTASSSTASSKVVRGLAAKSTGTSSRTNNTPNTTGSASKAGVDKTSDGTIGQKCTTVDKLDGTLQPKKMEDYNANPKGGPLTCVAETPSKGNTDKSAANRPKMNSSSTTAQSGRDTKVSSQTEEDFQKSCKPGESANVVSGNSSRDTTIVDGKITSTTQHDVTKTVSCSRKSASDLKKNAYYLDQSSKALCALEENKDSERCIALREYNTKENLGEGSRKDNDDGKETVTTVDADGNIKKVTLYKNIGKDRKGSEVSAADIAKKNYDQKQQYADEEQAKAQDASSKTTQAQDKLTSLKESKRDFLNGKIKVTQDSEIKESESDTSPSQSRAAYRAAKAKVKQEIKAADKEEKITQGIADRASAAEEKAAVAASKLRGRDNEMQDAGDVKARGCKAYKGADCDVTNMVNTLVTVSSNITAQQGANRVAATGVQQNQDLAQKGANATQQDMANGTINTAKVAETASKIGATVSALGLIVQGKRLIDHKSSIKDIERTANMQTSTVRGVHNIYSTDEGNLNKDSMEVGNAKDKISLKQTAAYEEKLAIYEAEEKEKHPCGDKASAAACAKMYHAEADKRALGEMKKNALSNIETNRDEAIAMQKDQQNKQMLAMASTAQALGSQIKAIQQAKMVQNMAAAAATTSFAYNPGAATTMTGDGTPPPAVDTGALVEATPADGSSLNPGNAQINPNLQDPGIGGNVPQGSFVNAAPSNGSSAPSSNLGASGNTTKAQDDAAAAQGPAGPNKGGGNYASDGNGGGTSYSRNGSNGGAAVGVDNSFTDMMKKLLAGGDDEKAKKDGAMAFDDRGPASDQAAVINRNKNIFDEIHKRYQKKSGEGAIVFPGNGV